MDRHHSHRWFNLLALAGLLLAALALPGRTPAVSAAPAVSPASVTLAGSLQSEIGCAGDWDPACAASHLAYDAADDVWQGVWALSADSYQYKVALNDSWDENYGKNATAGGDNILLSAPGGSIKFYYDHKSHWVTDNVNSVIATVPGSFQKEIGCDEDWLPDCLRSWLQDVDGDGTYSFTTSAIPAGNYEGKVALNESWDVNYGVGGEQNGPNYTFNVPANGSTVTFSYNATSHVLGIAVVPPSTGGSDNNVEWDGLRHDSRDTLYRTPGGAVPAGTPVTIRFRTFHNDVTSVKLRLYDLNAGGQQILAMTPAATDVSCYQDNLASKSCDFWAVTLPNGAENNYWYRFIVTDGSKNAYYADDTAALDGGLGATTNDPIDQSWALMVFKPGFSAPAWAKGAVIYQIFPDRFRNGRKDNDTKNGDVRYDDPAIGLPWGTLPEGYCRNYADATTANCSWRFGDPPAWGVGQKETPRGRDYMGGDLKGVDQYLDYLKSLGVNTIYFNPIFDAGSNHGYDTQDYYKVDPYFGTQQDWENLNKHADQLGIKIILDGVFNHMSSDSPLFDRYGHYPTVGACESVSSPYRDWFIFRAEPGGPCAGPSGPNSMNYEGWFGFDSIPVLKKDNPAVQQYFLTSPSSVTKSWLKAGAEGWRLDVSGDASFPNGYWEKFRAAAKGQRADALLVSETWQKDSTLLRMLRGDRLDTTMNYRLRDAVIGLLAPGSFDSKGFADSGYQIEPSQFAARLAAIREDYPDAAYYSLMNLLDSHDTERLLWTLTPGAETRAQREFNASNLAAGKQRVRLASLIQFTVPGAPTVYYGDEVGLTGDDDPDDRRTYPWADLGGSPDTALFAHYQSLAGLRKQNAALTSGDFQILWADDSSDTVAYGRKTGAQAAIVALNRSSQSQALSIPVAGYLPNGVALTRAYGVGNTAGGSVSVSGGEVRVTLAPMSGLLLLSGSTDLQPPAAPRNLAVTAEGNGTVGLSWQSVSGAAGYNVYRSPLSGGGWVKANGAAVSGTSFSDSGLTNARSYFYAVRALDAAGNESSPSNEVAAMPHLTIGWANLQWPPELSHVVSVTNRTDNVYGQVWIDGATNQSGATASLRAQLGFGPAGSNPAGNAAWAWVDAGFNTDAGNNDEFVASLLPEAAGSYDYVYRYSTTNGRDWLYADQNGPVASGAAPSKPGKLTVSASSDTSAPAKPTGLRVVSASPAGIELDWNDNTGDSSLYGYEVRRRDSPSGAYATIALVSASTYLDTAVAEGTTYSYLVRAVDTSFNRSADSSAISATPELRTVTLTFNVTVPASTDGTGRGVYIAGFVDRLDPLVPGVPNPQWNPSGVQLTRVNATTWRITFTGKESTQIEYKYVQGDWNYVEKDNTCGEISNRQLTLSYGSDGSQTVNDTVENWRNVAPCGN